MKKGFKLLAVSLCLSMVLANTAYADERDENVGDGDSMEVVNEPNLGANSEPNLGVESTPILGAVAGERDTVESDAAESDTAQSTVRVSDSGNAMYKISLGDYNLSEGEALTAAVWGNTKGQNDLKWYSLSEDGDGYSVSISAADHKETGDYSAHIYSDVNGVKKYVGGASFQVARTTKNANAVVEITKTEAAYGIQVSNIDIRGSISSVKAYVWSEINGQDDLRVMDCSYDAEGKTATASYPASDFSSYGNYFVHVYASTFYGESLCLGAGGYSVNKPSVESMTAAADSSNGNFTITIKGLKSESEIASVLVPIWSKADQSDIVWYTASKDSDGNYVVNSNISKHKNNFGPFRAHLYVKDNQGTMTYVAGTTVRFSTKAEIRAAKSGNACTIQALNITAPAACKNVSFAIWSEENGQDDLKWIDASYDASTKSAETKLDMSRFSSYGKYLIHAYGSFSSGAKIFLGGTEITMDPPAFSAFAASVDSTSGQFRLTLSGLASDAGISKVEIAVWTNSNNRVWYTAKDMGDGEYLVDSDISKHKYGLGTYRAHVYVTTKNHGKAFLTGTSFDMKIKDDGVSITEIKDETSYQALVSKLTVPAGAKQVRFAVWSQVGGQDDLKWYTASGQNGGDYTAEINIKNHKTAGLYSVHVYVQNQNGDMAFADAGTFRVNTSAKAIVSGGKDQDAAGRFRVSVALSNETAPVSKVEVALWTESDMSNLSWYEAAKQSDGTYVCTADVANHKLSLGNYTMHVYTTFANGIKSFSGGGRYSFNPSNYVGVYKSATGERTLVLKNPSSSYDNVRFGVWNTSEGAGKAHWYNAAKQSDGSYQVIIKTSDLSSGGTFACHCYSGSTFIGATPSFTVDKNEIYAGSEAMRLAAATLDKIGWDLRAAYNWSKSLTYTGNFSYPNQIPAGVKHSEYYAKYGFNNQAGNCYVMAATFLYMARALGYEGNFIEGQVPYRAGGYGPHGWCELKIGGTLYVFDPNFEHDTARNGYQITYGASGTWKYTNWSVVD